MTTEERAIFVNAVLDLAALIPHGRVTSFKKLAVAAGYPEHARMVGRIMSQSGDLRPGIPAYRVVSGSGALSGAKAFGHKNEMAELLLSEGVRINKNKVCDLKKIMWDPLVEL